MECFLTCIICGYQEIFVISGEDYVNFDERREKWLFNEEGKICPRCSLFPEAIEEANRYRRKTGTCLDVEGKVMGEERKV